MKNLYNADYFERGEHLGISGYTNYRWLPDLTLPMCDRIIDILGLNESSRVLDYGCAKGYIVKALRMRGISAYGVDVSEYAIESADADVREFVGLLPESGQLEYIQQLTGGHLTHVVCKDVLEHISYNHIDHVLGIMSKSADNAFIVVPLGENGKYVVPEYEADVTHVIREPMTWWTMKLHEAGYTDVRSYYRIEGIKDNFAEYERGNGFFICKR